MVTSDQYNGLSKAQALMKRSFDVVFSSLGLLLTWWVILIAYMLARNDTRSSGFFVQDRVGQHARIIKVVKIRTMRVDAQLTTTITAKNDPRITRLGHFFRSTKIDELPQLFNVLMGEMSFVGPRPDVPGFADTLQGSERDLLSIRPGITGPATLKYHNEEEILAAQSDPEGFNRDVIWPDKVKINLNYVRDWSLGRDDQYIIKSVFR